MAAESQVDSIYNQIDCAIETLAKEGILKANRFTKEGNTYEQTFAYSKVLDFNHWESIRPLVEKFNQLDEGVPPGRQKNLEIKILGEESFILKNLSDLETLLEQASDQNKKDLRMRLIIDTRGKCSMYVIPSIQEFETQVMIRQAMHFMDDEELIREGISANDPKTRDQYLVKLFASPELNFLKNTVFIQIGAGTAGVVVSQVAKSLKVGAVSLHEREDAFMSIANITRSPAHTADDSGFPKGLLNIELLLKSNPLMDLNFAGAFPDEYDESDLGGIDFRIVQARIKEMVYQGKNVIVLPAHDNSISRAIAAKVALNLKLPFFAVGDVGLASSNLIAAIPGHKKYEKMLNALIPKDFSILRSDDPTSRISELGGPIHVLGNFNEEYIRHLLSSVHDGFQQDMGQVGRSVAVLRLAIIEYIRSVVQERPYGSKVKLYSSDEDYNKVGRFIRNFRNIRKAKSISNKRNSEPGLES